MRNFLVAPKRILTACSLAILAGGVVGCASAPTADPYLDRASQQINAAQQAGAGQFAAVELQSAADNLRMAQAKEAKGDHREATTLAKRSELDATLAATKARAAQAAKSAAAVHGGTEALREETDKAAQSNPPATVTPPAPMPTERERP